MAERNLRIGGFDVAAFLAHQAVEKLLKTILRETVATEKVATAQAVLEYFRARWGEE